MLDLDDTYQQRIIMRCRKKFGVNTTLRVDGKKFHPIPIGYVSKGPIPI